MLTRLKLTRREGQLVDPSSQLSRRRTLHSPQFSRRHSPSMAHEESHETLTSEDETVRKYFYDMTKMVEVLFEERNARLQGESSNPQEVMNILAIKLQKEMEGMVILHLLHLHLPLILPFHNHLQILQRNIVKFLHKLLCLSLILSLNCLCTMAR
jgi:hypothetical protein